ncbi:MAG: hypothetical protein WC806_03810 [Candidatus Gracilibacteria bacterium]|jgi:hypothetical protein
MPLERQPWDGVERRTGDASIGVTSLKIATRAAEGTPLDAEQMFQDAGDPKLNNVRPQDLENLRLRSQVDDLFFRTAVVNSMEFIEFVDEKGSTERDTIEDIIERCFKQIDRCFKQIEFMINVIKEFRKQRELRDPINIERLVNEYFEAAKALNTVKEGDKPFPSVEDAIKHFDDLSPEELKDINQMQKPVFQLLPITSSKRILEDLNSKKPMDAQENARVVLWTKGALERADARDGVTNSGETIVGWNIAITEGTNAPGVLEGDDVDKTLKDRLAWFQTAHPNRGTDLKRYMNLQQAKFAKNPARPVDNLYGKDNTCTILNDEPTHDNYVAVGYWNLWHNSHVSLVADDLDIDYMDNSRFRLSVMRRCA